MPELARVCEKSSRGSKGLVEVGFRLADLGYLFGGLELLSLQPADLALIEGDYLRVGGVEDSGHDLLDLAIHSAAARSLIPSISTACLTLA